MALIGDHDRERVAAVLKSHYLRGRLSVEELGERLEVAFTARRDSELRLALRELPAAEGLRSGLDAMWRATRRAAFVAAVWTLWWAASLVLLVGFVVSVLVQGLSPANAIAFPALWLVCTFGARRVTRARRGA
jgi:hypothetical protein